MNTKRVYFVRHGESESNLAEVVQGLHDVLTPDGERQALRIAERAKGLDFDALISSDTVRTTQTAEVVAQATGKSIEFSELFREVKRPTSLIGRSRVGEEYTRYLAEWREHKEEAAWHREDEENYFDALERARAALQYLEEHPADNILVVTHGLFLKHMVSLMVLREFWTPTLFEEWNAGFRASNTGLTICYFKEGRWVVTSWNDHAHFAD